MRDTKILTQIPALLLPWYQANARDLPWRNTREPYHIWLSEVMLQQTRVEAMRGYYARFLGALPTIAALAAAPQEQLMKLWEGLGYYNRARNLQRAAVVIMTEHGGNFPQSYDEILHLPGIGPYTAGAIASICFGLPKPAVDGNVLRVYARLLTLSDCVDDAKVKQQVQDDITRLYANADPAALNQALMELGALICLPNGTPRCAECPLRTICRAAQSDTQMAYPIKAAKRRRRIEQKTVFILYCTDKLAVEKRPNTGLLANLWALPNVPGHLDETAAIAQVAAWGLAPYELIKFTAKTHIFTHIEWHMTGYQITCNSPAPRFTWITPETRAEKIALPTAFRQFLD